MIIVRLTGGLGNQMFQYAFGRRLALRRGTELKLDLEFYADDRMNYSYGARRQFDLDIFNVSYSIASKSEIAQLRDRVPFTLGNRILNRLIGYKETVIREPHFNFSEAAFDAPDDRYLIGYWQTEKYFADIESEIISDFIFRDPPDASASELMSEVEPPGSVAVHVRRGDFVIHPLNGLQLPDYYRQAASIMLSKVSDPRFYVFSDDIEWCRQNLDFDCPTTFVSDDFNGKKLREDFRLMSKCSHFIIANSSFSWWGAWLGASREKVVVAPRAWFQDPSLDTKDLFPREWILI